MPSGMEKGLLDGQLQGVGEEIVVGAVIQPGADVKSVVVSPSGRTLRHSVLRHL